MFMHPRSFAVGSGSLAEGVLSCLLVLVVMIVAVSFVAFAVVWISVRIAYWGRFLRECRMQPAKAAASTSLKAPAFQHKVLNRKPNMVFLAEPLFNRVLPHLSVRELGLAVDFPKESRQYLVWLKKAQAKGLDVLACVLGNDLAALLAREGEYLEAQAHLRQASQVFDRISMELEERQAVVATTSGLAELGYQPAVAAGDSVAEFFNRCRFGRAPLADLIYENLEAVRILMSSGQGVAYYQQAAECYRTGDAQECVWLLDRARKEFDENLCQSDLSWPRAAVRHDGVVSGIFAGGFGPEELEVLVAARDMARVVDGPFPGFAAGLAQTLELTGMRMEK